VAYEAVIGLECHVQLRTRSKMFCDCPAEFGAEPNTNVCPVCLGLPGALPRPNRAAVEVALRLALAVEGTIHPESVFARKNYFYPDLPKNYQITQYDRPLCEGGSLPVMIEGAERHFGLVRIHLEEDTGKSFHPERSGDRPVSRLDFNRAGVPLLELVTEPVFRAPAECSAFLAVLRRLVRWLGICEGDMEKGHMRCDANVSLRPVGAAAFGVKTELKNLNSIKGVERGLAAEIARQRGVLEAGGTLEQTTLLYDAERDRLAVMRSKEYAHDYRYFPDPDLPVLRVSRALLESLRSGLPELPWARAARFVADFGLPAYDAGVLCEQRELADYFEAVVRAGAPSKKASNWIMTEMLRHLKEQTLSVEQGRVRVPPEGLAYVVMQVESLQATAIAGKSALEEAMRTGADPKAIFAARGIKTLSTAVDLRPLVLEVLEENRGVVGEYLQGRTRSFEFLVGQVMKKTRGQAVPQVVQELLRSELARRGGPPRS
jgi:aspartyl-tRNA(Asn)/glutamyl-tRNA(Gln) amidotransferase subunit B